jgi:acyl-coenzyme A thioesterase PaaI-like protein
MAELVPAPQTVTYRGWRKFGGNRAGRALFSLAVVARAPYFGTIAPTVTQLRPGHCEVTAPKWIGIHNHIGTFHAIAACNLAEMAMGMLCEATVPTTHRWIPKSMHVAYLHRAQTGLRAVASLREIPDFKTFGDGRELVVPVQIFDKHGVEVVHADITTWVTSKHDSRVIGQG